MSTTSPTGVLFPRVPGHGRSTTRTGRDVIADAARAVDPQLADRLAAIDDWRGGYPGALRDLTAAGGRDGPAAIAIAAAGIAAVRARLVVSRDGEERPLEEALSAEPDAPPPAAVTVRGTGERVRRLALPHHGELLAGDALRRRLERWVRDGIVEPSCAQAVGEVAANPEWLPVEGRRIALIGAGAEIGPLEPLAAWGAEIVAIDLPRPEVSERLAAVARAGAGVVHLSPAGIDVPAELGAVRAWLGEHAAAGPLVVADHAYADGAAHVRSAAAAQALVADLLAAGRDIAPAYLATPTDCYLVPADVVEDARRRWRERRARAVLQAPLRAVSGGRLFTPSYRRPVPGDDGREWGLADAIVPQQGPSYALAKRIQRWSGVLARDAGHPVSFNVAPASWTRSVTKNRLLAAAYRGSRLLGVEIFRPETTRVLMAALLVHDLHRPERAAAAVPDHPDGLFATGAAHGGLWRRPYDPRSVLGLAALAGLPRAVLPG